MADGDKFIPTRSDSMTSAWKQAKRQQRTKKEVKEETKRRINGRDKGANGEREFAQLIEDRLQVKLVRNLEQSRNGGFDLDVEEKQIGPVAYAFRQMAIECKRYGIVTQAMVRKWWEQALRQAENAGRTPVLAYRQNRSEWRIVVPLFFVSDDYDPHQDWSDFELTVELSVTAFMTIVEWRTAG